jgi:hypothetical protein
MGNVALIYMKNTLLSSSKFQKLNTQKSSIYFLLEVLSVDVCAILKDFERS